MSEERNYRADFNNQLVTIVALHRPQDGRQHTWHAITSEETFLRFNVYAKPDMVRLGRKYKAAQDALDAWVDVTDLNIPVILKWEAGKVQDLRIDWDKDPDDMFDSQPVTEIPELEIAQEITTVEQTTGLTHDDVKILKATFPPEQVEFKGRDGKGYVFVAENAITDRLNEVDPSWSMGITNVEYRSDKHVVCVGWMTVKGITRHNIGEQENDSKPLDAAKGAATDLLKRLARMFGVGQYLTDLKNEDRVNDIASYASHYGFTPKQQAPKPQSNVTPIRDNMAQQHGPLGRNEAPVENGIWPPTGRAIKICADEIEILFGITLTRIFQLTGKKVLSEFASRHELNEIAKSLAKQKTA